MTTSPIVIHGNSLDLDAVEPDYLPADASGTNFILLRTVVSISHLARLPGDLLRRLAMRTRCLMRDAE